MADVTAARANCATGEVEIVALTAEESADFESARETGRQQLEGLEKIQSPLEQALEALPADEPITPAQLLELLRAGT